MTVLEFLCTQVPRSLQGLLIGLWHATFSIRYLDMRSLDYAITSPEGLFIHKVVRTGFLLLSHVMYVCVSCDYQYRIKDWVVNVQCMINEVFERSMDLKKALIYGESVEEQILFDDSSSSLDDSYSLLNWVEFQEMNTYWIAVSERRLTVLIWFVWKTFDSIHFCTWPHTYNWT